MYHYSISKPDLISKRIRLGQLELSINYLIEEVDNGWRFKQVILPLGMNSYSVIVSSIITAEYPEDRMQAIVNNFLADNSDTEAVAEMNVMQSFRIYAKETARQVLALL